MTDATEGLEVYLVGGAVRDRLLGRAVHERDWVVVGATPDDMTSRGFRQVGNDFPDRSQLRRILGLTREY